MNYENRRGVLLLHGICSNGNVFRPSVGPGLANLISKRFPVSIGEIRSYSRKRSFTGWDFDYHLEVVIPRIWKETCAFFGEPPFVLGYSMGGMLTLVAQARGLIQSPGIMVVGSPVVFPKIPFYPPIMNKVIRFASYAGLKRIPIRFAARLLNIYFYFRAGMGSRNTRRGLPQGRGLHKGLLIFHSLARKAGADVPVETLAQAVHWVNSTAFCDRTGKHDYLPELSRIKTPVFFLAGDEDRVAPPSAVRIGYETVNSPQKQFATIPGAGHLELVAGEHLYETSNLATSWFFSIP